MTDNTKTISANADHKKVEANQGRSSKQQVAATLDRIDKLVAQYEEVAEADAGFDGGEWSGPAIDEARSAATEQAARDAGFASYDDLLDEAVRLGLISFEEQFYGTNE